MEDRFKFKCWHEPTKTMYEVFDFNENFIRATPDLVVSSIRTLNAMDCVLMQCTGLKDKNDKLIYEGDIVQTIFKNNSKMIFSVVWNNTTALFDGKIIKREGVNGYFMTNKDYLYYLLGNGKDETSEVIGNIYENPELLSEDK